MDVDRARVSNYHPGGWGGYQGYTAQMGNNTPCNNTLVTYFSCGQQGHFAYNCPQKHFQGNNYSNVNQTNLINWNDEDAYFEEEEATPNHIANLKAQLHGLSLEETNQLANEMGASEDFHSA